MIRVLLIGVLALVALGVVAVNLPDRDVPPHQGGPSGEGAPVPPARYDGLWEGTLTVYRPDGQVEESFEETRLFTRVATGQRALAITRLLPGGRSEEVSGSDVEVTGGELRRRILSPGGGVALHRGRRVGPAIFWHRQDPVAGLQEALREEIVATAGGDVYTLDGVRRVSPGGQILMLEGRYRRADRTPR